MRPTVGRRRPWPGCRRATRAPTAHSPPGAAPAPRTRAGARPHGHRRAPADVAGRESGKSATTRVRPRRARALRSCRSASRVGSRAHHGTVGSRGTANAHAVERRRTRRRCGGDRRADTMRGTANEHARDGYRCPLSLPSVEACAVHDTCRLNAATGQRGRSHARCSPIPPARPGAAPVSRPVPPRLPSGPVEGHNGRSGIPNGTVPCALAVPRAFARHGMTTVRPSRRSRVRRAPRRVCGSCPSPREGIGLNHYATAGYGHRS